VQEPPNEVEVSLAILDNSSSAYADVVILLYDANPCTNEQHEDTEFETKRGFSLLQHVRACVCQLANGMSEDNSFQL
jgi:hypothetical protein